MVEVVGVEVDLHSVIEVEVVFVEVGEEGEAAQWRLKSFRKLLFVSCTLYTHTDFL